MKRSLKELLILFTLIAQSLAYLETEKFAKQWTIKSMSDFGENPRLFGRNNTYIYENSIEGQGMRSYKLSMEHISPDGKVNLRNCSGQFDLGESNSPLMDARSLGVQEFFKNKVLLITTRPLHNDTSNPPAGLVIIRRVIDMETCEHHDTEYSMNDGFYTPSPDDAWVEPGHQYITFKNKTVRDRIIDLALKMSSAIVLNEDGSYYQFNYDEKDCGAAARCRNFIDTNGQIHDEKVPYLSEDYRKHDILTYRTQTPDGYFFVTRTYADLTLQQASFNLLYSGPGNQNFTEILQLNLTGRVYDYDSTERFISSCWTEDLTERKTSLYIRCKQFDLSTNHIEDQISVFPSDPVKTLKIHQFDNGVLLLLAETCNSKICGDYSLYTLGTHGMHLEWKMGPFVDEFGPIDRQDITQLTHENNRTCVTITPRRNKGENVIIDLQRQCYLYEN